MPEPPPVPAKTEPGPKPRSRVLVERLAAGHFFSYPLAVLWAAAAIPLAIHLFHEELDALHGDDAVGARVVRLVAWPAGAVFVLGHAASLFWAFGRDADRGFHRYLRGVAALGIAGLVVGAASWIWLVFIH
jgi:hypothetical protein